MSKLLLIILILTATSVGKANNFFLGGGMGIAVPGAKMGEYKPSLNLGILTGVYLQNPLTIYLNINFSLFAAKGSQDFLPLPSFSFENVYRLLKGDTNPYIGFSMGITSYRNKLPPFNDGINPVDSSITFSFRKLAAHGSLIAGIDIKIAENVIFYGDIRVSYFDFRGGGVYWIIQGGLKIFFKRISHR